MDASTQRSLARIISHGLVKATAAGDPCDAVRTLLALQAQQPSSVPWVINLRLRVPSITQIDQAFESCLLVRSWPMRGTIHVTCAEDHHWLRLLLRHRYDGWLRSFEEEGLTPGLVKEAAQIARKQIRDFGPQSREELCSAWEEAGIQTGTGPQREAARRAGEKGVFVDRRNLFLDLHISGYLAGGPRRGKSFLFIDAGKLPPADGVAQGEKDYEAALVNLARRYAWGHGPVSAEDLARWAGIPKREAARALEGAAQEKPGQDFPIIHTPMGYHRADLDALLRTHAEEARSLISFPSFDEIHVGYADRSCLADAQAEHAICPTKNGMFRPFIIENGRVIAVKDPRAGYQFVESYKGIPSSELLEQAEAIAQVMSGY